MRFWRLSLRTCDALSGIPLRAGKATAVGGCGYFVVRDGTKRA